jgi:hypothetical protein
MHSAAALIRGLDTVVAPRSQPPASECSGRASIARSPTHAEVDRLLAVDHSSPRSSRASTPDTTGAFTKASAILREPLGARWCAWQESNLLPLAPQASALSGELQARVVQFRRASIAAVAALNAAASRLLTTTSATKTDLCQAANRMLERS